MSYFDHHFGVSDAVGSFLLANVNSRSRLLYVIARLSVICHLRPTQAIDIFRNVSTPFGTLAIC